MAGWHYNANNSNFDTSEGCLFTCSSTSTSNPSLTLVPPVTVNKATDTTETSLSSNSFFPTPGDDLSPPNAVEGRNMNGISVPVSASAGWSESPPKQEGVYPTAVAYDVRLKTNSNSSASADCDSLELAVALEYTNPHFENGESMMVKVAVAKTLLHAETATELALVATQFQEYIPNQNKWVDITADVDYTQTANAVVDAVLKDPNAGQTAGKATVTAETVELTLGPFSSKARLILTFQAEHLYTYEAMSLSPDAADIGSHRLLPLWVTLPFAPVHHEAGLSKLSFRLEAPHGTVVMPVNQYQKAYEHLKKQTLMKDTTIIAVADLVQQEQQQQSQANNTSVDYQLHWDSLPPRSCGVLAWLALPNPLDDDNDFDFVHIGRNLEQLSVQAQDPSTQAHAVLQVPSAADIASLQVPLPGHGPTGSLWRLKVQMPKAQPRHQPYFILNLTLSDKSGSTGMRVGSSLMRQRFNELAEVRFLKRLESIPALVRAGVLRLDDVWMDVFLAFNHMAPKTSIKRVSFVIRDVMDSIGSVVQAIRSNDDGTASRLPSILQHVHALRGVTPSGQTDFSVGPKTILQEYKSWQSEAMALVSEKATPCTFVEFDTDGGHNGSKDYLDSLQRLCEVCQVKNGVVTGFGSWLNQDCASKVARALGSVPAQLALQVPEPGTEGLNHVFRRAFSAWVSALRQSPPLRVKVSAGSVTFPSSLSSTRTANAVEVLALRRLGERHERLPKFGPPDVSNEAFTKTVIEEAPAGEELIIYIASRLEGAAILAGALEIRTGTGSAAEESKARVSTGAETSVGNFIAYDWLTMLTSKSGGKGFQLSPLMATSLSSRLEDEVSFRFNIASPSGRTSYLGRCKIVANRASIDSAHQPAAPASPIKLVSQKPTPPLGFPFRGSALPAPSSSAGLFGAPAPSFSPMPFGGPAPFGASIISRRSAAHRSDLVGASDLAGHETTRAVNYQRGGGRPMVGGFSASAYEQAKASHYEQAKASQEKFRHTTNIWADDESSSSSSSAHETGHAASESNSPSWADAMTIPVGCNSPLSKRDYDELKRAMAEILHARQRLLSDSNINYVCDQCNRQFTPGEDRFHCFDCNDYDACALCQEDHTLLFHRMAKISLPVSANQTSTPAEDLLVADLLKPTHCVVSTTTAEQPKTDQTMVWCKLRIQRFLLSVLHWWSLFRATCSFRDRLPATIPDDLAKQITHCCQNGKLDDLLNTVTIVIDSLMREDSNNNSNPSGQGHVQF